MTTPPPRKPADGVYQRRKALKMSDKQEKFTAQQFGGSQIPMSGAGFWSKNDVKSDDFLIECKLKMDPDAKSYPIKSIDLRDLTRRARMEGRIPLMQIDLAGKRYVVLPEEDFLDIIGVEDA